MNAQQIADLLAAARPGRKVEPLTSADPQDWIAWRDSFEITVGINNWGHQRARRELAAAMQGEAKRAVIDIDIQADAHAADVVLLLNIYEARFVTAAAGDLARAEFREAKQKEEETILQWHARLRQLYIRAYPNLNAAAINASLDLRDAFILGLSDAQVKQDTWRARPLTFAAALTTAGNCHAGMIVLKQATGMTEIKQEPIGAMAQPRPFQGRCWTCNRTGHRSNACPRNTSTAAAAGYRGGRSGQRGGGAAARGRGPAGRGRYEGGGRRDKRSAPSTAYNRNQSFQQYRENNVYQVDDTSDSQESDREPTDSAGEQSDFQAPPPPAGNE